MISECMNLRKIKTICKLSTVEKERFLIQRDNFRPSGKPCVEAKEFDLVRNMLIAAVEERYRDAGNFQFFSISPFCFLLKCIFLF